MFACRNIYEYVYIYIYIYSILYPDDWVHAGVDVKVNFYIFFKLLYPKKIPLLILPLGILHFSRDF